MTKWMAFAVLAAGCGSSGAATKVEQPVVKNEAVEAAPAPVANNGPTISAIEPSIGDSNGGTYAVLKGNRFIADGPRSAVIYFGKYRGTIVRFSSDHELIVQAPAGPEGETVDVMVVFEPGGRRVLSKAFRFVKPQ